MRCDCRGTRILVLAFWAVPLAAGCQFRRRSSAFVCDSTADCFSGRVCVEGFCVEEDEVIVTPDADPNAPDGAPDALATCPPGCTRCDADTCVIACEGPDACSAAQVVCPAGVPCRVECTGKNSCNLGIDCTAAASCDIQCDGPDSCQDAITCGPGLCRVECTDTATCTGGVDCSGSCQCDTVCFGAGSCAIEPLCPGTPQCDDGVDCDSMPGPCQMCI